MKPKVWEVLLIDDDPGICKVLTLTLEDAGYRVFTAHDGETGLGIFEAESPQIVLTDIHMPGIDGLDVLRRVKEKEPDTEVIVISGYGEIELAIRALQLDASDFVMKPVSDEALMVALKRARDRYVTRRELRDYTSLIEEKWMQTADELAKTFQLQRMLIESSIDGILACDSGGFVVIWNKAMEQMLDFKREEVIGYRSLHDFFPPEESRKFKAKLDSEEFGGPNRLFLYETTLLNRAGVRIPCQVSASVLAEGGEEIGLVCFFRDLREIRRLAQQFEDQARMLHQDKMISLGKLSASVVHEINNPISGVLNYTRLMLKILERGELAPDRVSKFQSYLSLMESELSRCSKIVSNLLAFSRKSKLEFGEVNLEDLLSRCISLSEHRLTLQNIRIEKRIPEGLPTIQGDFNQLQQAVINLIFNALDAMPDGGLLTIECRADASRNVIEIRVEDTGCGISEDDLLYIFDPFFTTKTDGKGLGLGLSTVYGIVDRHKGTISVKSQPGKGSTFSIVLPIRAQESRTTSQ